MKVITLRNKMIINSSTTDKNAKLLLENIKPYLEGLPFRIWSSNTSQTWNDIKQSYPQPLNQIKDEITQMASFYLRTVKPPMPNLLDRHQLLYLKLEVEILKVNFNNLNDLEVAVYFFSKQYNLVENFGHYLLLLQIEANEESEEENFMVELNSNLSIHTYKN